MAFNASGGGILKIFQPRKGVIMKIRIIVLSVFCLFLSLPAWAHNIWLERDGNDPARVYFGHIDGHLEETGGRLDIIKAEDVIFPQGMVVSRTRNHDHIAVNLKGKGDVAMVEAMNPRKSRRAEEIIRTIFLARAGRGEARPLVPLDLVPLNSGANRFTLMMEGKPLAGAEIKVFDPQRNERVYTTDAAGQVSLETPQAGRYVALAAQVLDRGGEVNGAVYQKTRYRLAMSFVVKK
jgi:uncharacterized GH25 family protein